MTNGMPKQFGLCLLLSFVSRLTFGTSDGEMCDRTIDICLKYDGYHARKIESAVDHCLEKGEELLEINSTEVLDFVDNFFKGRMSAYFPDGDEFNSFVRIERVQGGDVFVSRGLEVHEYEMKGTDSMCTKIKLKSSWTLNTCPVDAPLPVVCSKRPSEKSIFLQCIPAYLMYISLLVFGVGLAILFSVIVYGFNREIKLRKKRKRKEQIDLNPDFYEEISQRNDPSYMTPNRSDNDNEVNLYNTLMTAETIVEDARSGMLASGL